MLKRLIALLCCCVLFATLAFAQIADTATVVSIDKLASDAKHPEKGDQYKIAMRIGNTVYMCHGSGPASAFLDWSPGKQLPTKVSEKMLEVTGPNGVVVDLNVTGKKTAK
jgi:hypothetical protein